jgi:hypothetical protein
MPSAFSGECELLEDLSSEPMVTDDRYELTRAIRVLEYADLLIWDIRFKRCKGSATIYSSKCWTRKPNTGVVS